MTAYTSYMSPMMQGYQQPGQFDAKYLSDPLIQKLMQNQVQQQIMGAFAPQEGTSGFLDQLLGQIKADKPPKPGNGGGGKNPNNNPNGGIKGGGMGGVDNSWLFNGGQWATPPKGMR